MSRFPNIEKKTNGISLEKALDNYEANINRMIFLKQQIDFQDEMLGFFAGDDDYWGGFHDGNEPY